MHTEITCENPHGYNRYGFAWQKVPQGGAQWTKWTIGSFTHPDEITPYAGTAYYLFVGQTGPDGKTRYYQTWKEVAEGTFGPVAGEPKPKPPTRVSYADYGGSYSYIARGVLLEALRAGRPGAADALRWLEAKLPNRRKVLAADPTWAFAPAQPAGD